VVQAAAERADRLGSTGPHKAYGEDVAASNSTGFATYWRDERTGLDYADQRYYSPGTGRFLTADPYVSMAAVTNPSQWNRYAYVSGDPINKYDPYGLFECGPALCPPPPPPLPMPPIVSPGGPADGPLDIEDFGEDGVYQSGSNGPWLNHTFRNAASLLRSAAKTIAGQTKFKEPCEKTLAALGLSGDALRMAAGSVNIEDATTANIARAELYRDTPLYNSAVASFGSQTIAQATGPSSGIAAFAELSGSTVYIDSRWINPSGSAYYDRVATMMHELIHNATGLTDPDIQRALGLPSGASRNISDRLKKDCW
jgi:RHS repeat-associated protein